MSQDNRAEDTGSQGEEEVRIYQITLSESLWRDLDFFSLLQGTTNDAVIRMTLSVGVKLLEIEYGCSKDQIILEEDGECYEMTLYFDYDAFEPPDAYMTRAHQINIPEILWQELDTYGCFRGITTEAVLHIFIKAGLKVMQSEFIDTRTKVTLEKDEESYRLTFLLEAKD